MKEIAREWWTPTGREGRLGSVAQKLRIFSLHSHLMHLNGYCVYLCEKSHVTDALFECLELTTDLGERLYIDTVDFPLVPLCDLVHYEARYNICGDNDRISQNDLLIVCKWRHLPDLPTELLNKILRYLPGRSYSAVGSFGLY